jgi:hypothetical protein
MHVRRRLAAVAAAAAVAMVAVASSAQAAVAPAGPAPGAVAAPIAPAVSWRADLLHPGAQEVNLAHSAQGIRIDNPRFHAATAAPNQEYAEDLLAPTTLSRAVGRITATVSGMVPSGDSVTVDVRALSGGGQWTEWRTASTAGGALLGGAQTTVQARITISGDAAGAGPLVSAVQFTGVAAASGTGTAKASANASANADTPITTTDPESYRVFATDEGAVGGTTANGHVVQPNDHFVALPSGTALSPAGSDEYSVQVCGPAGCETAPVWDIGPWNIKDNYWDPSSSRQEFSNLPQGMPESQAAYDSDYNGGADDSGRHVLNPAGIDLADGTYHDVLGDNNGFVTVTYLWTSGGSSTASAESSPVVQYGSQMQVFGRDSSGAAYSRVYTPGSGWSGWNDLGGDLADDPVGLEYDTLTYGPQMEVFGRAGSGATYSNVYTSGGSWSGWEDLGGNIVSDPVAIQYGTQMEVYGIAANGSTYSDVYTPGGTWSGWQDIGGNLVGDLSVLVYGTQLQVYGRDSSGATYSRVYTPSSGWSGWTDLGGNLTSNPVAIEYDTQTSGPQVEVYGIAANGSTYSDVYTPGGTWSGWQDIGGNLVGNPSVLVYGTQLQVYGRDSSGATYSRVYTPGSGWSGWTDLGGSLTSDPVAIQYGSQVEVYGRAANGSTYSDVYTPGGTWSGWQDLGGNLLA